MKCLRCGYCCTHLMAIIVVDPEVGIEPENLKVIGLEAPEKMERCPHLRGDTPGEYSCAVHDREWYKYSDCAAYDQIGEKDSNCRVGERVLRKSSQSKFRP